MPHSSQNTTSTPAGSSRADTAVSEQTKSATAGNINQTDNQLIDQLSVSVTKLSLNTAKDNGSDTATDDLTDKQNGSGDSFSEGLSEGQTSASPDNAEQLTDSEVIVGNQNADDSQVNKELQAILQWMVASHLNVPNLTFINENDNELSKLPLLAEKAGKKAYTVGDILQEVKRYFVQQQTDRAVGNAPSGGLLDWLLANL